MLRWLCLLLLLSVAALAEGLVDGGLSLRYFNNTAIRGSPLWTSTISNAMFTLSELVSYGSLEVTGMLSPPAGYNVSTTGYAYQCTTNADIAFVWIDDHLVCHNGVYRNPNSTMDGTPSTPIPFFATRSVLTVRVHLYYCFASIPRSPSLSVEWAAAALDGSSDVSSIVYQSIPQVNLAPGLTALEQQRQSLQESEAVGWGTWLPGSILSMAHLPDGAVITLGYRNSTNSTLILADTIDGSHPQENVTVRVGIHTVNHSYAQYYYRWGGMNVSVESFVDRGTVGDATGNPQREQMTVLVTPISCTTNDDVPVQSGVVDTTCDVDLVVEARFAWYRVGDTEITTNSIVYSPYGLGSSTLYFNHTTLPGGNATMVRFSLRNGPLCFSTSADCSWLPLDRRPSDDPVNQISQEVSDAVESALMWNYVFVPAELGPMLPVSRSWDSTRRIVNDTRVDWGYILFDWDNYFASLMAANFSKGMCYSNLIQITRSKAYLGFVPNICAGGAKSTDRTEPPVGALVLRMIHSWLQDDWIVDLLFPDLLDWHHFMSTYRVASTVARRNHTAIFNPPLLSLVSLGSDPVVGYTSDPTVDKMMGARKESGTTNSPMYDGQYYNNVSLHLMEQYDVGFSSLVASEAVSLSVLAGRMGNVEESRRLLIFAGDMELAMEMYLWQPDEGIFMNLFYNQTAHPRVSPTSFYPLLTAAPTHETVKAMTEQWLLNESRFCLQSSSWPPSDNSSDCYWGLPSISADDPAFPDLGYWRGFVWGPMGLLTYLGLAQYPTVHSAVTARTALVTQMRDMGLNMWRRHRHICENFSPNITATDCTGTQFYHWGALTLFLTMLEPNVPAAPPSDAIPPWGVALIVFGCLAVIAVVVVVVRHKVLKLTTASLVRKKQYDDEQQHLLSS